MDSTVLTNFLLNLLDSENFCRAQAPTHTRQKIRMKHPRKFDDPPDLKLSALFRCTLRSPRDVRKKHRFHLNLQFVLVESWPDS